MCCKMYEVKNRKSIEYSWKRMHHSDLEPWIKGDYNVMFGLIFLYFPGYLELSNYIIKNGRIKIHKNEK